MIIKRTIVLLFMASALFGMPYNSVVSDVTFEGIQTPKLKQTLLTTIQLQSQPDQKLLKKWVLADIQTLYLTGYFQHVEASAHVSNNQTILTFHLKENPIIDRILFKEFTVMPKRKLTSLISNKKGWPVNYNAIQHDTEAIEAAYKVKGYDLFSVHRMTYNQPYKTLIIAADEGKIDRIDFVGLSKIRPHVLHRNIDAKEGSVFNSKTLRRDRERLLKLGYFSGISSPKITRSKYKNGVQVVYRVQEKKINRIDLGLEQDDEEFVLFLSSLRNHNLIHSDVILGKVQLGQNERDRLEPTSYFLRYKQPWLFNKLSVSFTGDLWKEFRQSTRLSGSESNRSIENIRTNRIGGNVILGKELIRDKLLLQGTYKSEHVAPEPKDMASYRINSLSLALSYNTIRNLANPKRGLYWKGDYERGGDVGFATFEGISFSKTTLRSAVFFPPHDKGVLGAHLNVGYLRPDSAESEVFETESFILGGANSLRGYNDQDYQFVGNRKILWNFEYRLNFYKQLQFALFYDMGKAFDEGFNFLEDYQVGKGFGFRFYTPIGAIRLDIAQGDATYIHLGLGQLF